MSTPIFKGVGSQFQNITGSHMWYLPQSLIKQLFIISPSSFPFPFPPRYLHPHSPTHTVLFSCLSCISCHDSGVSCNLPMPITIILFTFPVVGSGKGIWPNSVQWNDRGSILALKGDRKGGKTPFYCWDRCVWVCHAELRQPTCSMSTGEKEKNKNKTQAG